MMLINKRTCINTDDENALYILMATCISLKTSESQQRISDVIDSSQVLYI